jgi:hypothetical protein
VKPHDCATYFAVRAIKQGMPQDGEHATCSMCGRSYIRRGPRWEWVSTVDEIRALMAAQQAEPETPET